MRPIVREASAAATQDEESFRSCEQPSPIGVAFSRVPLVVHQTKGA